MRENTEQSQRETNTALGLAALLLNLLILFVLYGCFWLIQTILSPPHQLSLFLKNYTIYQ